MLTDVRNALRALKAAPGFTAVALVVLTLGIGATTAIFSVVDAVVLRSLPFDQSDRLGAVVLRSPSGNPNTYHTAQDFVDWREQQDVFQSIAATSGTSFAIQEGERPEELRGQRITAGFFDVFRVLPQVGRPFTLDQEAEGSHRVVLISDGFWRRRYAADPDIVGQTITTADGTWEIQGVMPRGFAYPLGASRPTDVWIPWFQPSNQKERGTSRSYYLQIVGRLKDDVSLAQANDRLKAITSRIAVEHPDWFQERAGGVDAFYDTIVGASTRSWMLMLLGSVAFVLLIACVNVANLMLARASSRIRETGVRAALGASRWQIARGMLVESLLLSVAGTACGLVVAWWGVDILKASLPRSLPRIADIGIDLRVLSASAGAALVTGVLFGLAPALQFSRPNLTSALREGGRGTTGGAREWLRSSLVVAEVALAMVLLVGAGLFISSFVRLVNVEIGVRHENVLTMDVFPRVNYADRDDVRRAQERSQVELPAIVERIAALPGVVDVGFIAGGLPLSGSWSRTDVKIPGREEPFEGDDSVDIRNVTPGYGDAIGATVLRGRYIQASDTTEGQPVIVLNEEAVKRYLGEREPLGATITLSRVDRTVVGVVRDVRLGGPESAVRPEAYVPYAQSGNQTGATLVVHTAGAAGGMIEPVKQAVWASMPEIPLDDVNTMEALLGRLIAQRQFNMLLVGVFGLLALVIAAAGIYGVMAYIVTQRTQEIGVRMALGAMPRRVLLTVLSRASAYMVAGLVAGLGLAWLLAASIEGFLFQVEAHDITVYAATSAALFLVGTAAAVVPARRAARVDPLIALRS
jgi:putative ABC transport system permease protein